MADISQISAQSLVGSKTADRMRLHRRRRRDGIHCVTIELYELEIDALVRKGWLRAETCHDSKSLRDALYHHLGYSLLGERDA